MKKFLAALVLITATATAAAQEARPVAQPSRRAEARPLPGRVAPARPVAYPPACQSARPTDLVGLASHVVATVSLSRFLWAHPEVLLPPPGGAYPPAAERAYSRRLARRPGAPASARFGLKAGLSLANITGVRELETKSIVGLNAGLMADFSLGEHLAFHPELLYSRKGAKGSVSDDSGASFSEENRLSYLDLPLLLRAKANGFFLEAGPQLGYLLAEKNDYVEVVPGLGTFATSDNSTADTHRLEVGYVLGLGYALPQGLEVGVRYNGGLTDLQNPAADPKLRNSVFQFQVGYLFGNK